MSFLLMAQRRSNQVKPCCHKKANNTVVFQDIKILICCKLTQWDDKYKIYISSTLLLLIFIFYNILF